MDRRNTFPKSRRIRSLEEFSAVYDAKVRDSRGPFLMYARPNGLPHPRLGLSTSRKVGTAVKRNRIRRLLREAFRLLQHELPAGYDLLIVVKPHKPLELSKYRAFLMQSAGKLEAAWKKRTS